MGKVKGSEVSESQSYKVAKLQSGKGVEFGNACLRERSEAILLFRDVIFTE